MEEEFLDEGEFMNEGDFINGEENFVELKVQERKPLQHSKGSMNLLSGVQPVKKRELTYDDILGSMNLKVVDGQLQYIQPQKPTNFMKKVKFSEPLEKEKIQEKEKEKGGQYMNYVPRSKEEHQKMMFEHMKKQMEARIKNQKSTKLLFTNNLPQQPMQPIKISNHFLQFVKTAAPMRPLR
jgi:hypothetical protein